jgi:phosphomannomutase/phosphoglucomutase
MRETGALLAGEMSGHFFFADRYYGFDDALYASCRLVELLEETRRGNSIVPLSHLFADLPRWSATPEIRISCPEEHKHAIVRRLAERLSSLLGSDGIPPELRRDVESVETLDGLRLAGPHGWGLIRASNTEPALILRFEGANEAVMNRYRSFMEGLLADLRTELSIGNS